MNELKDNVFYQNRKAIQAICKQRNVDVNTGTRMFLFDAKLSGYPADLAEWDQACIEYARAKDKTLADLFR